MAPRAPADLQLEIWIEKRSVRDEESGDGKPKKKDIRFVADILFVELWQSFLIGVSRFQLSPIVLRRLQLVGYMYLLLLLESASASTISR